MLRTYFVTFENVAVAAAQDLFEIGPADDKPVVVMGGWLDNVGGIADAGDAQEEFVRVSIVRGHATSGSGGTVPTPRPADEALAAAGFTAEVNNTTIASAGTPVTMPAFGFANRIPSREIWPEEWWVHCQQATGLVVVRLLAAPADSINLSGTLVVGEV